MGVEEQFHASAAVEQRFDVRVGRVEVFRDEGQAEGVGRRTLCAGERRSDKPGLGYAVLGNDNFLALESLLHERGELRLGIVEADRERHGAGLPGTGL
jgi:hypothetical protein